jgi:Pyruvate/2-oxoacid:ferredoxin oxidoreductase delta subunit
MCEFCQKHGEGEKWYLNVKNYSHDLLSDLARNKFITNFFSEAMGQGLNKLTKRERIFAKKKHIPANLVTQFVDSSKEIHFGQVIPIEDVRAIFEKCSSISRIACGCRWATSKIEERCCFGITIDPNKWYEKCDTEFFGKPELAKYEEMSLDAAMESIKAFDNKGLIHSVWTFMTPFIGAVCNCDMNGCMAMRHTHGLNMQAMFRAEYVAEINESLCNGCRACENICPLKSVGHLEHEKKCRVDKTKCYGCGVCRSVCNKGAITLKNRAVDPIAAAIW